MLIDPLAPAGKRPIVCGGHVASGGIRDPVSAIRTKTRWRSMPTTLRFREFGRPREQVLVAEEEMAAYIDATLLKRVAVGATGALLWCFADYDESLHGRPPCDHSVHERFFGLVRKDGSLKSHAAVLKQCAATAPIINESPRVTVSLNRPPDDDYRESENQIVTLYRAYLIGQGENPERFTQGEEGPRETPCLKIAPLPGDHRLNERPHIFRSTG